MRIGVTGSDPTLRTIARQRAYPRQIPPSAAGADRHLLHAARLRQLLDVGRSLTAELDLDVLLERVLQTARELCGARYAALGVLDDERRELAQFLTAGEDEVDRVAIGHLPRGRGILRLLIDQPVPIRLHDVAEHPRSYGFPPGHPPMRSFLGAPIVVRGEAWGNLYLTEKDGAEDFDDDDLEAVVVLAEWAAIAIDNARLFGIAAAAARRARARDRRHGGGARHRARARRRDRPRARARADRQARPRARRRPTRCSSGSSTAAMLRLAAHAGNATPAADAEIPFDGLDRGRRAAQRQADARRRRLDGSMVDPARSASRARGARCSCRSSSAGAASACSPPSTTLGQVATFSDDDERALRSFAASAATAVATARGVEAQRVRDSIGAAEAERRRWARDLHDETLQGLGATKLALTAALRGDPEAARPQVDAVVGQLEREITALRGIIADLRPPALDELGLEPALRTLAARIGAQHDLALELDLQLGDRRLDAEIETIAYRVAQEALTNVVKHAGATRVRLGLRATASALELSRARRRARVRAASRARRGARAATGSPACASARRSAAGSLRVTAGTWRRGTTVALTLPLRAAARSRPRTRRGGPPDGARPPDGKTRRMTEPLHTSRTPGSSSSAVASPESSSCSRCTTWPRAGST